METHSEVLFNGQRRTAAPAVQVPARGGVQRAGRAAVVHVRDGVHRLALVGRALRLARPPPLLALHGAELRRGGGGTTPCLQVPGQTPRCFVQKKVCENLDKPGPFVA